MNKFSRLTGLLKFAGGATPAFSPQEPRATLRSRIFGDSFLRRATPISSGTGGTGNGIDLDMIGVIEATNKSSSVTLSRDYLRHYQRLFSCFLDEQINIIEIGVSGGQSLKVWKAFFTRAHIIGVDINPTCARFADDRVSIEIGSQDDPGFLLELAAKYPPSIIIDDGSHRTDHVIYTFERLFPSLLPGGIYIVEDLDLHIREPKKWQGPGGGSPSDYFLNVARSCLARSVQGAADWGTVHYTLDHVDDVEFVRGATIVHKIATKQNITSALDFADVYLDGRASEAAVHERLSQFILRHDGPPERAETELRRAIELGGETPGVLRNYAHIRLREQRLPEAAVLAERCATVAEDDPHAWDFAGSVHTRNGDHAAAARAFGRAVALRPGNPGFALALSQSLQRIGRLKEALSAARQGLEVATGTAQEEVLRKRVERLLTKVGD